MNSGGIVYIITNKNKTVLYIGVTNNIHRRMQEHKNRINKSFASRYNCIHLVYYESFWNIADAIQREKVLKKWNRSWKEELIEKENPEWKDLCEDW